MSSTQEIKVNSYFEGKVQSVAAARHGRGFSVGVIQPGACREYLNKRRRWLAETGRGMRVVRTHPKSNNNRFHACNRFRPRKRCYYERVASETPRVFSCMRTAPILLREKKISHVSDVTSSQVITTSAPLPLKE